MSEGVREREAAREEGREEGTECVVVCDRACVSVSCTLFLCVSVYL